VAKRPHILILMTDQQRADCLGCAGHPVLRTPNMDRIASQGARFENALTTSPICMPARACFVSGLYCHNHGMWTNTGQLPPDDETFFHHLRQAGYYTAYVGKSHFYEHHAGDHLRDHEEYMRARGIDYVHETTGPWATVKTRSYMTDRWEELGLYKAFQEDYERRRGTPWASWPSPLPEEEYLDSYIGRQAVEFVEACQADQPVCLFVGFGGPHEPFDPPGRYAAMYDPARCPEAVPAEPVAENLPPAAAAYVRDREKFLRGSDTIPPEEIAASRAGYYGKIALIDHWVGRILEAFAGRGWLDDTLIVLWSDHGEMVGDHGRFHKSVFYESSVRVPLLLRWPGEVPAGVVRPHLAQTIDVFDTLLEAAGCEPSARSFGKSLLPPARDENAPLRDAAFSEIASGRAGDKRLTTMILLERYKYAVSDTAEPLILFDLAEDPLEQNSLAGDPRRADLRAELDRKIYQWLLPTQISQ
jgi:arylsulfatase